MKIYEYNGFANPRRVRIFLAEKGVSDIEYKQIDVMKGEHRKPDFLAKNPYGALPIMELEDGTHISESLAICLYCEEKFPENPLLGETPKQKAEIEMWQRRVETTMFNTIETYFHHGTPGLGALEKYQNDAWGQENKKRYLDALEKLDKHLEGRNYFAGNAFSVVDITAICAIGFAEFCEIKINPELENMVRWYADVSARPSFAA